MKVLLAVEQAGLDNGIADFMISHRWPTDTVFRVLHVIPWLPSDRELASSSDLAMFAEQEHQTARKAVEHFVNLIRDALPEVKVEQEILDGDPARKILATASAWPADMIVVGSREKSGLRVFILGSVSSAIVNNTSCSVVVVRDTKIDNPSAVQADRMAERVFTG